MERVLCCTSTMKNPKSVWGEPSCDDHVCIVGCKALYLRVLALVKFFGNSLWYQLRDIVLTLAPGST